jgi:hypothetical protein
VGSEACVACSNNGVGETGYCDLKPTRQSAGCPGSSCPISVSEYRSPFQQPVREQPVARWSIVFQGQMKKYGRR